MKKISKTKTDVSYENFDSDLFRLAVENAYDHIIITNKEGKILFANEAAEKITGYSAAEMKGKTPALWGGQMDTKFYQRMWQQIKTKKKTYVGEIINKRKNGDIYYSEVHVTPILDERRRIKYFVGIEQDITEQKEIDRAKTNFISLAAHELRAPLAVINWYTEMILTGRAGELNARQRKYFQEIYQSKKNMIDLVNALLNVFRIELGNFAVKPKKISFIKIVDSAADVFAEQIKIKKLRLVKKYDKDIPALKVDPQLIKIVIHNLMSNATKYTPEKGKISLEVKKRKDDILIKITDSGYGIPKDQHQKIFTKLFRADNIKSKVASGTGLGLYIVKAIVELAGGKIWFKSPLFSGAGGQGKGSVFYVTIPLEGMKEKAGTKELTISQ